IPFCRSKCPYCGFYSLTRRGPGAYIDALENEILTLSRSGAFVPPEEMFSRPVETVYFGGGTPSFIGADALSRLLGAVFSRYSVTPDAEVTVEVNPRDSSPELFAALHNAGFNRLSLGLQSAVDSERRSLGRLSGARDVEKAVSDARGAGFSNISLDLMLGVPGQTEESLEESLDFTARLRPEHISTYMLSIEPGTVFEKRRAGLDLPDADAAAEMYLRTVGYFSEKGYSHYEISNLAVPGFESRHNTRYWRLEDYLGLGAAAHSLINRRRFSFAPDADAFIAGAAPTQEPGGDPAGEYMMLALRLREGFSYARAAELGVRLPAELPERAGKLVSEGLAEPTPEGFRLTAKGMAVENSVIIYLEEDLT
ncbi:MAG: radical SAM family heme chaperone HemW, partial [Clostridia bacterium]|nr:radical SAM family heme chaperone HemW [Clostridia bacterium]